MEKKEESEENEERREYLKTVGALVAGLAVGGAAGWLSKPAERVTEKVTETVPGPTVTKTVAGPTVTVTPTPAVPPKKEPVKGGMLVVDYTKCTGCMLCALACAEHWMKEEAPELAGDTVNLEFSRIRPMRFQYVDVVNVCKYCKLEPYAEGTDKHPCEAVCPYGALHTVPEGEGKEGYYGMGYLWVDPTKCVGLDACGKCLEVCEEQFASGISFNPITKRAQVCTMCGGLPVCVDACPEGAIEFVVTGRNGRVYAETPEAEAELLYMKLFNARRDV